MVAAQASRRAALKAEIAKLEAEREAFLKAEAAKRGTTDAPSLESELIKGTGKTATKKGYNLRCTASLGGGTEFPGFGAVRYGGEAGKHGAYRLHLRYLQREESAVEGHPRAAD